MHANVIGFVVWSTYPEVEKIGKRKNFVVPTLQPVIMSPNDEFAHLLRASDSVQCRFEASQPSTVERHGASCRGGARAGNRAGTGGSARLAPDERGVDADEILLLAALERSGAAPLANVRDRVSGRVFHMSSRRN